VNGNNKNNNNLNHHNFDHRASSMFDKNKLYYDQFKQKWWNSRYNTTTSAVFDFHQFIEDPYTVIMTVLNIMYNSDGTDSNSDNKKKNKSKVIFNESIIRDVIQQHQIYNRHTLSTTKRYTFLETRKHQMNIKEQQCSRIPNVNHTIDIDTSIHNSMMKERNEKFLLVHPKWYNFFCKICLA
jgi:hypothetical protein